MKDKIEKYITKHREDFDVFEPDPVIWDKIDSNIHKKKRTINLYSIVSRAAVVIFIFSISFMVSEFLHMQKEEKQSMAAVELKIPELQEAEFYYSSLLSQKMEEIKPMLMKDPELKKEITMEINELDSIYNELKNDLRDNIANQEIIEAMIQNYRLKLEILEEILLELKETNNNNENEKSYNHI